MLGGFSSYLFYGLCAAGVIGGGVGISYAFLNKKVEKPIERREEIEREKETVQREEVKTTLIAQYLLKESGNDKCGTLTEVGEKIINNKEVTCSDWKGQSWYKKGVNNNSLLVRVNKDKSNKILDNIEGFLSDNYENPSLSGISKNWKTKNGLYSCGSTYDQESNNQQVIITCIKQDNTQSH